MEFDNYALKYEKILEKPARLTGSKPAYFANRKRDILRENFLDAKKILDFGCGSGFSLKFYRHAFDCATIYATDPSEICLAEAQNNIENILFVSEEAAILEGDFDLIVCSCVMHHVEIAQRVKVLRKIYAALRPGGSACFFEHNPRNPVTRLFVKFHPLDKNAKLLTANSLEQLAVHAGFTAPTYGFYMIFPEALKDLCFVEKYFQKFPVGAQYWMIAAK